MQEPEEDVRTFVIRLKNVTLHCSFGNFVSNSGVDKFVCVIRSQAIKRKDLSLE